MLAKIALTGNNNAFGISVNNSLIFWTEVPLLSINR
jgi:hypothetical protein